MMVMRLRIMMIMMTMMMRVRMMVMMVIKARKLMMLAAGSSIRLQLRNRECFSHALPKSTM